MFYELPGQLASLVVLCASRVLLQDNNVDDTLDGVILLARLLLEYLKVNKSSLFFYLSFTAQTVTCVASLYLTSSAAALPPRPPPPPPLAAPGLSLRHTCPPPHCSSRPPAI